MILPLQRRQNLRSGEMMLRKKNKLRFKNRLPKAEINIISLMDVLTTLLFFLLVIASAVRYSTIPASSTADTAANQDDSKPKFALQVTVVSPTKATVYLGPTGGLKVVQSEALNRAIASDYKGDPSIGYLKPISVASAELLQDEIEETLILIKKSFPAEMKAVVAFTDVIPYQQMVDVLGRVREIKDQAKALALPNVMGELEKTRVLFPEILITEWVSKGKEG